MFARPLGARKRVRAASAAILAAMTHARGNFGGKRVQRRPVCIKPVEPNKYRDRKR